MSTIATPTIRRLIAGMGANAYGQGVNVLIQLVSLPVYLSVWDMETYGIWLALSAIPAYLSMADVGMVSVAGNRMTMLVAAGDHAAANRVFQSAQVFVVVVCVLVAVVALPMVAFLPGAMLALDGARTALSLLVILVLIAFSTGLAGAAFRCRLLYAQGTAMGVNTRLAEWLGGLAGLFYGKNFVSVAVGMLLAKSATSAFMAWKSTQGQDVLQWGGQHASRQEIAGMIRPALGMMAFPLTNALSFQGFTLLAAATLGPAMTVVFNAYRTVARVVVQLTSVFSHALWPEISRLFGAGKHQQLQRVLTRSTSLGVAFALTVCLAVYLAAPSLIQWWSQGKITYLAAPMGLMMLYAFVASCWHVPRSALMAINRHSLLGIYGVVISALGLLLAWALAIGWGWTGLSLAMVLSEMLLCGICLFMMHQAFRTSTSDNDSEAAQ